MSGQPKFDVFLAHNSKDKELVEEIAESLEEQGLSPWLDKDQILGGDLILDELQLAIKNSTCAAFFIGRHGLGKWQQDEQRVLIQQSIRNGSRVIPVVLPCVSEDFLESAEFLFLGGRSWLKIENYQDVGIFIEKLVKSIKKSSSRDLTSVSSNREPRFDSTIDDLLVRKSLLEKKLEAVELEIERVTLSLKKDSVEPGLDILLHWLSGRRLLAERYGRIALRSFQSLRREAEEKGNLDDFYFQLESYLELIYLSLSKDNKLFLREPQTPPTFADFDVYDHASPDVYREVFRILKENIPNDNVESSQKSKLEEHFDELCERLQAYF
ncbi:toll/interleukin-1 receptor domain-containing protein [Phormidium sp. CLA17]|uniref:toll/interleukin-1 receptor domain-containing protein n=1 Tax=Leptolyngbya sp. Cla-17 TaxID=2803751 RepID=UPI001491A45D|nr:toll/interleukin-1 receptor domain-containing protein [Leptolyngbya sp. Cla-17]MBM0743291.1 toll/interleukin-1 receptor domain-containing protein [Leptolyngbya sp. Cla-17]